MKDEQGRLGEVSPPAKTSGQPQAETLRPASSTAGRYVDKRGPKSSYAQSRKCRGCVYAGLFYQFERENIYYCDYLRRVGHKRPVSAEACRGWDANGKYRITEK